MDNYRHISFPRPTVSCKFPPLSKLTFCPWIHYSCSFNIGWYTTTVLLTFPLHFIISSCRCIPVYQLPFTLLMWEVLQQSHMETSMYRFFLSFLNLEVSVCVFSPDLLSELPMGILCDILVEPPSVHGPSQAWTSLSNPGPFFIIPNIHTNPHCKYLHLSCLICLPRPVSFNN